VQLTAVQVNVLPFIKIESTSRPTRGGDSSGCPFSCGSHAKNRTNFRSRSPRLTTSSYVEECMVREVGKIDLYLRDKGWLL
jgi:hypothetical protein